MSFKRLESGLLVPEFNIAVPKILPGGHNLNQMLQYRAPRRRFVPLASQQYSDRVNGLAGGPIGYWRLQESAGTVADNYEGTAARDGKYGTNGNEPTLGETGIGDGLTSVLMDATDDYIDIYSASLRTAFDGGEGSLHLWAKVSGAGVWTDGIHNELIRLFVNGNNYITIANTTTNNRIRWTRNGGGTFNVRDKNDASTTAWFTVSMVWSETGDYVRPYFNGLQVGGDMNGLGNWAGNLNASWCSIGAANRGTPGDVWDGWVAHGPVWDTPLTASQVLSISSL